ncbi:MAG: diaminopimelate decarboxylase [Cyclobacteriaceae bacterium]|nr:diaminopimelate decarboxylase [Cyclobacteriaceae bacterium]
MINTPFYYYDLNLLDKTLQSIDTNIKGNPFKVHYALKANAEEKILKIISDHGFGADCVSGNEINKALECGFNHNEVVLAGVGKSDNEIRTAIDNNIHSINCESIEEIRVIAEIAQKEVNIALRINPNINANTHPSITTGTSKDKFGIPTQNLWEAIEEIKKYPNLNFIGLHFHLGSQITDMLPFKKLSDEVNSIQSYLISKEIKLPHLNMGGGIGIDYNSPKDNPIPNFEDYFNVFKTHLNVLENQTVHFELGRSIIGQSGSLISKVLYVKNGANIKFAIIDAGMTDLIRPALYNSFHAIENISSDRGNETYQVVGPICESTDTFGNALLTDTNRGDYLKIFSAGAYGQVLSSNYNLRDSPKSIYSDQYQLDEILLEQNERKSKNKHM